MKSLEYVTTESPENFLTSWKVCFDNISEPHEATTMDDISTITSDHGKPQCSGESAAKANFISHQIHSPATHLKYVH